MKQEEISNKINKLMRETKLRIQKNERDLSIILIDFANDYRYIWEGENAV